MIKASALLRIASCTALVYGGTLYAQAPTVNINAGKHPNLASAQNYIVQAYQMIDKAQAANHDELGNHGEKAKALLSQADAELRAAANASNQDHR